MISNLAELARSRGSSVQGSLQSREIHSEGQAHGEQGEEPCWQSDGCKSDDPVQCAWQDGDDAEDDTSEQTKS